ncbi:MAG: hypothetical protein ACU0BF_10385 [Paracoccaceae bacterium]
MPPILPWRQSALHPQALTLDADALPDLTDETLSLDLADLNPPPSIRRLRAVLPMGAATRTMRDQGFRPVRLTRVLTLPCELSAHPALRAPTGSCLAGPAPAMWWKGGAKGPWAAWLTLVWSHYAATHALNPPRDPGPKRAAIFAGDDLIEAYGRQGPDGTMIATAALHMGKGPDAQPQIAALATAPAHRARLGPTLAAALRRGAASGHATLTLQVDDTDAPLWSLAHDLDLPQEAPAFVTWHRERDGTSPALH